MSEDTANKGMGPVTAVRLEFGIIGLGILALLLIFQPFSIGLFGIGTGLVVLAGLLNNLLPLCQPDVSIRTVAKMALLVFAIFLAVMAISIGAAYLYGQLFVLA